MVFESTLGGGNDGGRRALISTGTLLLFRGRVLFVKKKIGELSPGRSLAPDRRKPKREIGRRSTRIAS